MKSRFKWTRRDFLKTAGAATLATLASGAPRPLFASSQSLLPSTADCVVLLWMAGGMAHTETFDPKKFDPDYRGKKSYRTLCTFPSIPTSVDGVQFSKGLEGIASVMDRGTLVRSFSPPDLGHILHSRHQFHWHTGYVPPQSIEVPHIGSMIARTLGPKNPDIPPFIHIGQRLDIDGASEVQAFLTPGFLGWEYGPLLVTYPDEAMKVMSPPAGMSMSRFESRQQIFKKLVSESPVAEVASDFHRESLLRSIENGYRLIRSPSARAFDLTAEPKEVYEKYNTGRFGLGCLLARRLVEAGARFIEVTTEHIPFGNWDTHDNGHRRTEEMKRWVDAPITQLVLDLEERGLLNRTLIIIASEFSRLAVKDPENSDPKDPANTVHKMSQWGMHRHFTKAGSVLFFGGGMKQGHLYGKTSDESPCETIESPATLIDLHATMYRTLGIPPDLSYEMERRPYYVTDFGNGKPIADLFAKEI